MKLSEIIKTIYAFDDEGTIFTERINGNYLDFSDSVVIEMTDEDLELKTAEGAAKRRPGKSYFLEVFLAKEFLGDFAANHNGRQATLDECLSMFNLLRRV